jgi:AcrR family transcriptional regulator
MVTNHGLTKIRLWSYTECMEGTSGRALDLRARKERAERILDAAAELLLRYGYKRVTIDDVAEGAGIGKGTIYLHWKSREALFLAVLQRDAAAVLDDVLAAVRRDAETALLHRAVRTLFLGVMRRPLARALFVEPEVLGNLAREAPGLAELAIPWPGRIEIPAGGSYFELLAHHGALRPDIALEDFGHGLGAIVRGFFFAERSVERSHLSLERRADLLAATLRRTFESEGTPPPEAVQALASGVIELFTGLLDSTRANLRRAYE